MSVDPSRRDRMVAMYRRGLSTGEIAAEFSVNPPAVRMALIRAGAYQGAHRRGPRRSAKTAAQIASLAEHVAEGGEIAAWGAEHGILSSWYSQLWNKILRDLGQQAA